MEADDRQIDLHQIRLKAWRLCRSYLTGVWKSLKPEDLVLHEVRGGLSNLIFFCGLPQNVQTRNSEPSQVLLRIFGNSLTKPGSETADSFITGLVVDNVIFTILSERRLGPQLLGVFAGGRLEEYIPAKSLTSSQLRKRNFSHAVARKMAKIHQLHVPINTDPKWIFESLDSWNEAAKSISLECISDPREKASADRLLSIDFTREIEWLRKWVDIVNSPVTFCHNDLQGGNILLRNEFCGNTDNLDENLVVIDFEFCSYNYRAFDMANHMSETIYDYTNKEYPYFFAAKDKFPTKETQMEFLQVYLNEMKFNNSQLPKSAKQDDVASLQKEVESFFVVSNLLWALWSMAESKTKKVVFGHWAYAEERMQCYFRFKEMCQATFGNFAAHV